MSVNSLIKSIKENNEDFEWYPTTEDMIKNISNYLKKLEAFQVDSVLDVGCGNGSFLNRFNDIYNNKKLKLYGIEKSPTLVNELSENINVVGTDLFQQSLLDKRVDMIFCNPPYSEYLEFMDKVINEGCSDIIVFIVPERWKENKKILNIIENRELSYDIIGNFDFLNAERKARAKVDIVIFGKFKNFDFGFYKGKKTVCGRDVFSMWFDEQFKIKTGFSINYEMKQKNIDDSLVDGENIVTQLISFYNDDLNKLYENYKGLEKIDGELFNEMGVNLSNLKEGLKQRIEGLKNIYWTKLFSRYDKITNRLCSYTRDKILNKLNKNTGIDFTEGNIGMITLWVIKNANKLYDEQLIKYFKNLCNSDSIHRYKSNKRFNDDDWKYIKKLLDEKWYYFSKAEYYREEHKEIKKLKNLMLDYRIVHSRCYSWYDTYNSNSSIVSFIKDTVTIAENLGYEIIKPEVITVDYYRQKEYDLSHIVVKYKNGNVFADFRCYKNNNVHIKFDQKFMKHLNVEASRLLGWINDKSEVSKEMNVTEAEVSMFWNKNIQYVETIDCDKLLID